MKPTPLSKVLSSRVLRPRIPFAVLPLFTAISVLALPCLNLAPLASQESVALEDFPDLCATESVYCASEGGLLAIATSREDGDRWLRVSVAAQKRFQSIFSTDPISTVVVANELFEGETGSELRKQGFEVVLPWLSGGSSDSAGEEKPLTSIPEDEIRRQIEAQVKGMPTEEVDRLVQAAVAQIQGSAPSQDRRVRGEPVSAELMSQKLEGALSHELGHLWFVEAFWSGLGTGEGSEVTYGGDGPDWLDEIAAILLENEALVEQRRSHMAEVRQRGDDPLKLDRLTTMDHPLHGAVKDALDTGAISGGQTQVLFLTGEEADEFLKKASPGVDPQLYYSQIQTFSDFLRETQGADVFARLARGMARGAGLVQALGAEFRSLSELESDWLSWLSEAYPTAP